MITVNLTTDSVTIDSWHIAPINWGRAQRFIKWAERDSREWGLPTARTYTTITFDAAKCPYYPEEYQEFLDSHCTVE